METFLLPVETSVVRYMLSSSILMTSDVIVHVVYLIMAFFSVDLWFLLPTPDGFLYLSGSSVWLFVNNVRSIPVYDVA